MNEQRIDIGYGAVTIALVSIVVYAIALANGFAFDDVVLIPRDTRVTGTQIGALLTNPYWQDAGLALYRPLTSVSFALDWYASKGAPSWFHFTNILWHATASILAYLLLARFYPVGAALCGGLLFALHPVHVEAVANIVGRGELIAAVFFFAACLVWSARSIEPRLRTALTALCYALAMFGKEGAVVLPAILLLISAAQGGSLSDQRKQWKHYATLGVVLVAFLAIRMSVVGGLAPARLDPSLEMTATLADRLRTALQAWPVNARLLFYPRTLLADYGPRILMPIASWTPLSVVGLTLLLVTVIGGLIALARGSYRWALGLLWYPVAILPVSNLIIPIGVLVAERTLYLPSFAISIAVAAVLSHTRVPANSLTRTLLVVIAVALTVRTVSRIPEWDSTDRILAALVRDRPDGFRGQWHAARYARNHGQPEAALQLYERAIKIWPYREGLVEEAASFAGSRRQAAWARQLAAYGTQRWPRNVGFHRLLAANAVDLGDTLTARRAVNAGLAIDPNDRILKEMWQAFGRPVSKP